jgi:valyl-tRNA synthetase
MDTWATSSLTPQIAGGWPGDEELYRRVFPMDLRPQAHEIIRTWLFYTVLRSEVLAGTLPWQHVAISGWILDPDRKKMSKSIGNVVTPADLLLQYGSDAVRYWAASARLGVDTAFDVGQIKVGRRLAVKILNASKFVLGFEVPGDCGGVNEPLDLAMLSRLGEVVTRCTTALDDYEHASALEAAEQFFWNFCDDYLELVKPRAYAADRDPAGAASAVLALRAALSVLLRLFAPVMPFVTEEVWSWFNSGSIHRSPWPRAEDLAGVAASRPGPAALAAQRDVGAGLDTAANAIRAIRKAKSEARLAQKAAVTRLVVRGSVSGLAVLEEVLSDVVAAGNVGSVELISEDRVELAFEVTI